MRSKAMIQHLSEGKDFEEEILDIKKKMDSTILNMLFVIILILFILFYFIFLYIFILLAYHFYFVVVFENY